ncbi:MAG: YcxB family protein [Oceanospirillaceae bacterium]|nr:YcxB family protein [Oceanospirillaceae bacterium]
MTDTYSYSTSFIISREHLSECFEQSVEVDKSIMAYKRAIISLVFGACLLAFNLVSDYLGFFVMALGVLEVFSTRYKKTWWLWRQMFGKSYKSKVTLLVDAQGINNSSTHVNTMIEWSQISEISQTQLGLIVRHTKGSNYLSLSCLDDAVVDYMLAQVNTDAEDV